MMQSGKSYLVNLAGAISMGKRCPVITSVKSEEEMEKQLGGLILGISHDIARQLLRRHRRRPAVSDH